MTTSDVIQAQVITCFALATMHVVLNVSPFRQHNCLYLRMRTTTLENTTAPRKSLTHWYVRGCSGIRWNYHLTIPHCNACDPNFNVGWILSGRCRTLKFPYQCYTVLRISRTFEFRISSAHFGGSLRCIKCSILARQVDQYNDTILKQIYSPQCTYMASESPQRNHCGRDGVTEQRSGLHSETNPPGLHYMSKLVAYINLFATFLSTVD